MLSGGTGSDVFEVDANGNIVPHKSNSKNFYTTDWVNGVPKQAAHPVGPRVTPPVWDAAAQQADDAATAKWDAYHNSLPGMNPAAQGPQVNTAASLLSGTTPTAAPNPAPAPNPVLGKNAMTRQLSPSTMVSMNSPLQNGLWGYNLWNRKR